MGMPVVIAATGGLPVVVATNGFGVPCTIATNGFGIRVTQSANGIGLPVAGVTFGPSIVLTGNTVLENSAVNTVVGALSMSGTTGTPAYTLTDTAGGRFKLVGSSLQVAAATIDFETATFHNVTVSVTGVTPVVTATTFTIVVLDVSLAAPAAPTLTLTSPDTDTTPDFTLTGDLVVGDTVRFQYSTSSGFAGASELTNAIDAAEDTANLITFTTGALALGTWYFRARIERPEALIGAWSNTVTDTIVGAAYTGPGDAVAGLVNYWGLRAATAALRGNNLIRVRDMTTTTETDIPSDATTGLLNMTALAAALPGGHAGRVTIIYDQVGSRNQLMGLGELTRAALIKTNMLNGLPSLQWDSVDIFYGAASVTTRAQPFTICFIARPDATSGATFLCGPENDTTIYVGYRVSNGSFMMSDNSGEHTVAKATGSFYNGQAVFNGASSALVVAGTSTGTVTVAATGIVADAVRFGGAGNGGWNTGYISEIGIWSNAFDATKLTAIKGNQDTYMANA